MQGSNEPNQPKSGGAAQSTDQSRKPQDHPGQSKPGNPRKEEPIQQYLYRPRKPKRVQA